MFTKIDKKVLVVLIVVIAIIALAGFAVYKYLATAPIKIENSSGGVKIESLSVPQVQIPVGGIQVQGDSGRGGLTVCLDKCGDNICQKTDPSCVKGDQLNCVCPETLKDCPQDCK